MEELWESENIGIVNGNPVFRRIMQNFTTNFHTHNDSDEMFIVESGELQIDFEAESLKLTKGNSFVVKAGIQHRAIAKRKVTLIVIGGHN
ncbi:cupin domain-containing protein [Vibrio sp. RC27]